MGDAPRYTSVQMIVGSLFLLGNRESFHWRASNITNDIRYNLSLMNNPQINLIQHTSSKVAAALAGHGIKARHISLFHKGLDMPRWLMKMFENTGLHF